MRKAYLKREKEGEKKNVYFSEKSREMAYITGVLWKKMREKMRKNSKYIGIVSINMEKITLPHQRG